jgi:hypothetical protein
MTHSAQDIQKFVVDCRAEEARHRVFGIAEENLWDLAEAEPFEPTRIITTNEQELADPYLMRVYLTPEREKLEELLLGLNVPLPYAKYIRHMPRPYLHYFFRGDDDRAYHNHPWKRSLSLILIGGYIEHKWDFKRKISTSKLVEPGGLNYLQRGTYHRVELLPQNKCWTLFVSSGRVHEADGTDWEFYDPETDTFTPHGEWTAKSARPRPFGNLHERFAYDRTETGRTSSAASASTQPDLGADPDAGHGGYNWSALR